MTRNLTPLGRVGLAALTLALAVGTITSPAEGAVPTQSTSPATLSQARSIRAEINARIGLVSGAGLSVTEATSTDVLDSFTLLSADLLDARFVPAKGGVWYTICPERALCPYPALLRTRPAADYFAQRLALELVVRTFLETDAPVVGVALPTPNYVALVVEREELEREVNPADLAQALRAEPLLDPPMMLAGARTGGERPRARPALQRTVDALTRPRTYLFLGLESGPYGNVSWAGLPCWPVIGW
jgi:hypothetical protein